MPLILYSSDGLVTQVDEQPELSASSHPSLICLLAGEVNASLLAMAYGRGGLVYAAPDSTFHFHNILDVRHPIISPLAERIGRAGTLELLLTARNLGSAEA